MKDDELYGRILSGLTIEVRIEYLLNDVHLKIKLRKWKTKFEEKNKSKK